MTTYSDNLSSSAPLMAADIAQLPAYLTAILCQLALLGELSKSALLDNTQSLNISPARHRRMTLAEMDTALDVLQEKGWLQKMNNRWNLKLGHENAVFLYLLTHENVWLALQQSIAHTYLVGVLRLDRVHLWLAILVGDKAALAQHLAEWMSGYSYVAVAHPAFSLLANEVGKQVFSLLDDEVQALLLATFLSDASYRLSDCTDIWRFTCDYLDALPTIPTVLRGPLVLQALWRDDRARLDRLTAEGNLPLIVAGWMALCRGDRESAMDAYQQLVSHYRKATGKRKLRLQPLPSIMAALTLLARDEPAHATALAELTRHAVNERFGAVWVLLTGLLKERDGKSPLPLADSTSVPFAGMLGVLQALVLFWHGDTPDNNRLCQRLKAFSAQLAERGYQLLAYEINTHLHLQFDEPAPVLVSDRLPLCQLWQRKASWEYALDALGQLTTQNNGSTSRLAWLLRTNYGLELMPLEQKYGKNGWSKGRPVALKRLYESADTLPWLLAQDRQAVRHIHHTAGYYGYSGSYELDADSALLLLAGHPAVFWHDAPDVRIDIESGQVMLVLEEVGSQLSLQLTPGIDDNQRMVIEKETPTRLVVYPVSDEHRRIAAIVGKGLHIPASARERVLQSVSSIAPLLPIQANLPELMTHIPHVPPDETIYAHLLPLGEGLRLQLLVRPLQNGLWLPPGRGSDTLNGERDGQTIQTRRELQTEQQKMQQVLQACPALNGIEPDNTEWQFSAPQDALEVLAQLRAVDQGLLECVWPEGERMRVAPHHNMHSLRLNIGRQGEWFTLSGELLLDDGRVLQLRQVLTLLQESQGRFIRLGEQEWMALDNQLHQRLRQITLLAGSQDGKDLKLNVLTLPFLKELSDEAGNIEADEAWHQQLRQLQAREKHRPVVPSTLKAELRDYQQEGFYWLSRLAHWGIGACLADDMGLGKTLQALALLLERAGGGPQLVVAPTSVTHNWLSESERFAPTLRVHDYQRQRDLPTTGAFDVVVVSYGLLLQDVQTFTAQHWHSVVLDEAQAIKNAQTKRAQAVMALKADFRLALSGTPVENHLGELWSLFRFLNPGLLGGMKPFNQRFIGPIEQGDRLAGNTLKQLIRPFVLRRTKTQVLGELPPRTDILYKIPMSEEELHWYEALRQQAMDRLEGGGDDVKPLQVLTEITRLRRFCCHPSLVLNDIPLAGSKLSACLEIISELRENHHKALVFSQFVDHLTLLRTALDERNITYQYLDGSTSPGERKKRVTAFQSGEGELFLISLKAGGTGLNLTAADYVLHLDPWWNPAVEDQASDRAHRMGQNRPVTVYRLVMEGTIEEQMVALHTRKRQLAEDLLEGSDSVARLNTQALLSVLRGQ
ncbi:DEAD/DEAH box helicase [Pseudomonas protegens]|uniref:DEAD/DEAH box helicase n=1 Tax=Pseudomonas protegens TaxID=380021 RepID=UPI00381B3B9B